MIYTTIAWGGGGGRIGSIAVLVSAVLVVDFGHDMLIWRLIGDLSGAPRLERGTPFG
eukprot:SAG31_NODE_41_length_31342_cov_8.029286_10_plen_57_part_00